MPVIRAPTAAHLASAKDFVAAVAAAARRFAPGLVPAAATSPPAFGRRRDGRWFRQGRNITVING